MAWHRPSWSLVWGRGSGRAVGYVSRSLQYDALEAQRGCPYFAWGRSKGCAKEALELVKGELSHKQQAEGLQPKQRGP